MPTLTRPTEPDASTDVALRQFPDVLSYWFGELRDDRRAEQGNRWFRRWYGKDKEVDSEIRSRFEVLHLETARLVRDGWRPPALRAHLAAVVILDQLPRNMYRETPAMYAADGLALTLTKEVATRRETRRLDLFELLFLNLPWMHSERMADQDRMLSTMKWIVETAAKQSSPNLDFFSMALRSARRHREIIKRFGRFPHRNAILGRVSTAQEIEFLTEAESSF